MSDPTRLPLIGDDTADESLQQLFTYVREATGEVPNLYRTLAHAPFVLDKWIDFAWTIRNEAATDRGLRELLIMRNAQLTGTDYEWRHHWPLALAAGVTEDKLNGLTEWAGADQFDGAERAALAMVDEITHGTRLSDDAWRELAEHFEPPELVELVLTVAFYCCVNRVIGSLQPLIEDSHLGYPEV